MLWRLWRIFGDIRQLGFVQVLDSCVIDHQAVTEINKTLIIFAHSKANFLQLKDAFRLLC